METEQTLLKWKVLSSMEKVLPWKEPSDVGARTELQALKGETVSFQIGYFWNYARKSRAKIRQAMKPELPGVQIRVRTAALSPCNYPCHEKHDDDYLDTRPGLYPDLLKEIDEFGIPLVSGQWRSIWIDLKADENAQAGEYACSFVLEELKKDGGVLASFDIRLNVLPAVLPEVPIPHTEWFHCDCLANYYHTEVFSERHWELIENFVRTAASRGCNMLLTPLFTPPLDTAVGGERRTVQLVDVEETAPGTYRFSFEKLERWVRMAQRCGIRYFEMSHLFTQWGAGHAPKIMAMRAGEYVRIFGWESASAGEEYSRFLNSFLDALIPKLGELGIAKDCFFHISDEPSREHMDSYRAAKAVVEEKLKGFRIIDALSDYEFYKSGLVSEPICACDHLDPFLENRPQKLWTYYCTAQCVDVPNRFIAQPGYRTRILGTLLYRYQIDGFLQWGYNFYNSEYSLFPIDPYRCTDADGTFPSGDPFLVYPGGDGHPEESIRLMLMDEAFNDLRAMTLLEQLKGREAVLACLNEDKYGTLTFKKYPRSAEYLAAVRERVNEAIEAAL